MHLAPAYPGFRSKCANHVTCDIDSLHLTVYKTVSEWHAFRRGLATNLHQLGVQDKVIQRILRHSNVAVTQACYLKTADADVQRAMEQLAVASE